MIPEGGKTAFVRDPDGYIVEVNEREPGDWFTVTPPTTTSGPGMSKVYWGQMDWSVKSETKALEFYRGLMGFDIEPGYEPLVGPNEHPPVPSFLAGLLGITPGSPWGAAAGNCAPQMRCEFFEYDDPARRSFTPGIQNPGTPFVKIRVQNLDAMVRRITKKGLRIVTPGREPVTLGHSRSILIRDTSGFLVQLVEG